MRISEEHLEHFQTFGCLIKRWSLSKKECWITEKQKENDVP